jgi:transcriptional regulator with XRE-family HTH domain
MFTCTGMRLLRILRGQTLADVAKATGIVRGHLSSVELDSANAGRKAQQALSTFHSAPWSVLAKEFNASVIADGIVLQLTSKKATPKNA